MSPEERKQSHDENGPAVYPNRELAVYALFLLGGDTRRLHTEDVAIRCFELFPTSFSWAKHTNYPDKDIVRVALTDARKDRYGAFVEGRAGQNRGHSAKTQRGPVDDGWILTTNGIRWVQDHREDLETLSGAGQVKEHRQATLRQIRRLREHPLFVSYSEAPAKFAPTIGELADMLRCRVDAGHEVWARRFEQVRRQAESTEQRDVIAFIARCETSYMDQH
jgi:hypothetical protein